MTTPMPVIFNVETSHFDPIGNRRDVYFDLVARLPDQLKHKLTEARWGNLCPPAQDPEAGMSDEEKAAAYMASELQRMAQAGQIVAIDKDGKPVEVPAWQPPTTVVGEGSLYGILCSFGGGQTAFVPLPLPELSVHSDWEPRVPDEAIALMCLKIL